MSLTAVCVSGMRSQLSVIVELKPHGNQGHSQYTDHNGHAHGDAPIPGNHHSHDAENQRRPKTGGLGGGLHLDGALIANLDVQLFELFLVAQRLNVANQSKEHQGKNSSGRAENKAPPLGLPVGVPRRRGEEGQQPCLSGNGQKAEQKQNGTANAGYNIVNFQLFPKVFS